MKTFHFETCCINAKGNDIREMVDQSRDLTYRTFFRYVSIEEVLELFPVYERTVRTGLTIKKDYCIQYSKSKYQDRPCYYLTHSAIEYIFTTGLR